MTARKASTKATADSLWERQKERQVQKQQRIPFGNDRKKSKSKGEGKSVFLWDGEAGGPLLQGLLRSFHGHSKGLLWRQAFVVIRWEVRRGR